MVYKAQAEEPRAQACTDTQRDPLMGRQDRGVTCLEAPPSFLGPMILQGRDKARVLSTPRSHYCYVMEGWKDESEQVGVCPLSQHAGSVGVGEGYVCMHVSVSARVCRHLASELDLGYT